MLLRYVELNLLTSTETPYDNMEETFEYFKSLLLCHSVKACLSALGMELTV